VKIRKKRNFFVHPRAICETSQIGIGTRIWAFSHIMERVTIGLRCNIGECVFIEAGVIIGNDVTIKNGVQIWNGVEVLDNVFIGPNVTFTNDRFPKSRHVPNFPDKTLISSGVSIGANSTILSQISIGENAFIGAGSVVTHSVPPNSLAYGNPAKVIGPSPNAK
jgi:UDP-2-acetamido-3-amino-2,3-dideoxy-glucuronate N-acetyltransferase